MEMTNSGPVLSSADTKTLNVRLKGLLQVSQCQSVSCGKCVLKMCVESEYFGEYCVQVHNQDTLTQSPTPRLSPFLLSANLPFLNLSMISSHLLMVPFPPTAPLPTLLPPSSPGPPLSLPFPICLQSVASCLCEVSLQAQETSRYHLISTLTKLVFVDLPSSNTAIPLDTPLRCIVCTCHGYGSWC